MKVGIVRVCELSKFRVSTDVCVSGKDRIVTKFAHLSGEICVPILQRCAVRHDPVESDVANACCSVSWRFSNTNLNYIQDSQCTPMIHGVEARVEASSTG